MHLSYSVENQFKAGHVTFVVQKLEVLVTMS